MKLNPQDLEKIASLTLDHYNERAADFWQGTRDHDVKQNIAALFQWIDGKPCVYRKPKPGRNGDEVRRGLGVS